MAVRGKSLRKALVDPMLTRRSGPVPGGGWPARAGREPQHTQRLARKCAAIRTAVLQLHQAGHYPSQSLVEQPLGDSAALLEPAAKEPWYQVSDELGWEPYKGRRGSKWLDAYRVQFG
jgi:hypothetical protein